jgi:energy-coupling factor transporter ATP-binding protein EcfA2
MNRIISDQNTLQPLKIDERILNINQVICRYLNNANSFSRGEVSQDILAQLRNLIEHIMLKIYANGSDIDDTYECICAALKYVRARGELRLFSRFHHFLEVAASHYTVDEEKSERLMLKYYEYLLKIKNFVRDKFSLGILNNIDQFPVNIDSNLKEYYEKIIEKIKLHRLLHTAVRGSDRFYIQRIKPIFINQEIYYEVIFTRADGKTSKFDRIIAFTDLDISQYYAAKLRFIDDQIEMLGEKMPVLIIVQWEVSIRPCEIENFAKIFKIRLENAGNKAEYHGLMTYLTKTGLNLTELLDWDNELYENTKKQILTNVKARTSPIFDLLDRCKRINKNNMSGCNVLWYLLYHLNNKVIKLQLDENNNKWKSGLRLTSDCLPFDRMPFISSLRRHNPKLGDLFNCFDAKKRKHEVLARFIKNNIEVRGKLYTDINECSAKFKNVGGLIEKYNQLLWEGHVGRRLEIRNNHIYIKSYEEDIVFIVNKLKKLATIGITNYSKSVMSWLQSNVYPIDSNEKKTALTTMFENSTVALIYGAAGTGKSTLINHLSHFFTEKKKLYLANTNPAVDNLKRRVNAANCSFSTIAKFINGSSITDCDLLFIDECSTVSNKDMKIILEKATFKLLVLVGDVYQIESIRFGNWFDVIRSFIPSTSVFELTTPYRNQNNDLRLLWDKARNMNECFLEFMTKKSYSISLDESIFSSAEADEIVLCLNYDGLYGINNVNRFLQESNPQPAVKWGEQSYKVNDPILFNESERFAPLIYNNMKGRIVGVEIFEEKNQIQFDIELDKAINGMDAQSYSFDLLDTPSGDNSIIRFTVDEHKSTDEDNDLSKSDVVPFQVAYAVSIHKAQGLEYSSVKIVITDEIDELITHNIFYTAITRTRNKLRIYWTPEVENKILSNIKPRNNSKDVRILRNLICVPTGVKL